MSTTTQLLTVEEACASPTASCTLRLSRRLLPLHVAAFFQGVSLWVPVEKLFMNEIGFTPASIGLMAAAYAALVPVLEVPSGILADRSSRRGVLMVANAALALSAAIGALSHGVGMYIVAALMLGVYFAMNSGTLDSMVYDTVLEETGNSAEFEARIGRVRLIESAALAASSLAGGWLAMVFSTRLTYVANVPFVAMSVVALFAFREPRLHRAEGPTSLRTQVATTYRTVLRRGELRPVITLMVLAAMLLQVLLEFGPLWLVAMSAPAALYGPAFAGLLSALGLGGLLAGRLQFERRATVLPIVSVLLVCSTALTMSHEPLVVTVAQVVLAMLFVAINIFLTRLLHDSIPSSIRAGVSSGVGTFTWVVFLPFALVFGVISDRLGVHVAGWMIVAITAVAGASLLKLRRPPALGGTGPKIG